MEVYVKYFISLNILLLLQAVYYRLFLANQRRFQWNRVYLLGGMAVAMARERNAASGPWTRANAGELLE